jgi:hypothetical protein
MLFRFIFLNINISPKSLKSIVNIEKKPKTRSDFLLKQNGGEIVYQINMKPFVQINGKQRSKNNGKRNKQTNDFTK